MRAVSFLCGWLVSMVLAIPAPAAAQKAMTSTLASWRDRARPLLVFAPSAQDPRLIEQLRLLDAQAAEVHDRDLIVLPVVLDSAATTVHGAEHSKQVSAEELTAMRRRFHIAPGDFTVILVGKDGGEKLRQHQPFSTDKLFGTVDAMPMRQDEMRSRPR